MPLPKIENPIFELTLPSNQRQIKYRPFLVKEQKILFMALETGEAKAMVNAMKQIVSNCAIDEVDVEKMAAFDLEYFFLRLRAKSVGEEVELTLRHPTGENSKGVECDGVTPYKVNLLEVEVTRSEDHTDKIMIDEEKGIGIKLVYPKPEFIEELASSDKSQFEIAAETISACIEFIYDKDNIYKKEDHTKQELIDFIDSLSQDQFQKIMKFFETAPRLKHEVSWTCAKCGCADKIVLEGIGNFFAF